MKKAGFTLIELMVVIVILGVLAAIGVPKIFATIEKAKISEIPVAAGSYIHLQDAYLAGHNAIGNWTKIGYKEPESHNFCYSEGITTDSIATNAIDEKGIVGWAAQSLVSLRDCTQKHWWALSIYGKSAEKVNYQKNSDALECAILLNDFTVSEFQKPSNCAL